MRQRVTSAIALAGDPRLLIADEPTSALDTATQLRYLQLIEELQATEAFALLFVTHDLSVVREVCDRVMVMYSGEIVEEGEVGQIFDAPKHPYSRALLDAIPQVGQSKPLQSHRRATARGGRSDRGVQVRRALSALAGDL